jgi:hypothetical protein
MRTYGPTLSPAQEPDIISPTTYFGNGIQDWAHQKAIAQAGTSDEWFYTTATFDHDNNPSTPPRPVSKPIENAYWTSAAFSRHMDEAFNEWTHRQLSDSSIQGGGFDATGIGGGFGFWLRTLAQTHFSTPKPIVAYEGGPSLYTDYLDGGDVRDDGITNFIVAMNRQQRIKEVYRTHLHMAKAKGLWSHMMFVDVSTWGKYGQWGHLERYSQDPASSPKYSFIREWIDTDTNGLRHIDRPQGGVPSFVTPGALADGYVGSPYSQTITTTGGNGARTVQIITRSLVPGLVATASGSGLTVSGVPTATGSSYVYALVKDGDGDPAWRTFTIRTVARSTDPAVTVTFEGLANTSASNTPEPLDISGYRFRSLGNTGGSALQIQGTAQNWASNVLFSKFWGSHHRIARADGRTFDLFELEIAAHQARSAKITGFAPGGIRLERVVNIPLQEKPMTKVSLDWITLEKVEIQWYELANAAGGNRNGAIDNVKFNTGTGIPGGGSAPASPSGLVATTASATQINLTWSDNANNETAYKVERAASSGGPWTEIAGSLAANTTSYSATGLSGSTTYHFRVRAANSNGNSGYSNTANATTSAGGGTVPVGPSGLSATTASATQINLSWTDNANDETAYKVERATSSGGPWTEIAGSLAANTTSYSATGLSGSTTYHFRVRAANSNGNSAYSNTANATTSSGGGGGGAGSITREVWTGISGTTVAAIPVGTAPNSTGTLASFEAPTNVADNYGQRVRGYITPPSSGNYTFWIAGDDNVQLWLSTSDNPANKVLIASHNDWTGSREWGKYASQRSGQIALNAGTRYYIEALMKEGSGGDNLAVSWRLNNTTTPATGDGSFIIPGSALSPWEGGGGGGGSISQTVNRDYWTGISGTTITTLTTNANYPNNPTGSDTLSSLQAVNWSNSSQTSNWADDYGQRIRGYIVAPATGSYTFWISGDDDCEFWLSTDANPANRVRVAHITGGWTGALEWNKYASQKSTAVNLTQGQRYYIEVLHKEGGGGDSLAVGWARPGQATTTPSEVVPGSVLDAFVPAGNPPPPPSGFSAKVNFQTATAATPSGYVADSGQTYAARNGLTYGWSVDKTGRARERNVDPDKRRDTLVHFDTTDVLWEIAVPNGTYSYTIVCGDPSFNDQVNTLQIESTTLADPNGTAAGFDTFTGTVTVSDGRLSLRMGSAGNNAKINYIDLTAQ